MAMIGEAEFYRARAAACRALARKTGNAAYRRELQEHARIYEKLAEVAMAVKPTILNIEPDSAFLSPPRAPRRNRK